MCKCLGYLSLPFFNSSWKIRGWVLFCRIYGVLCLVSLWSKVKYLVRLSNAFLSNPCLLLQWLFLSVLLPKQKKPSVELQKIGFGPLDFACKKKSLWIIMISVNWKNWIHLHWQKKKKEKKKHTDYSPPPKKTTVPLKWHYNMIDSSQFPFTENNYFNSQRIIILIHRE